MSVREIHGIAEAIRWDAGRSSSTTVTIRDGIEAVMMDIGCQTYGAILTPDQADYIAKQLMDAAARLRVNDGE